MNGVITHEVTSLLSITYFFFPHLHVFSAYTSLSFPPRFAPFLPHLLSNATIFLSLFSSVGMSSIWSSLSKDLQSIVVCVCVCLSELRAAVLCFLRKHKDFT